ncbi:MAG: preprotein translocase subunit SecA [Gammaproteobacteria bacterium]|nr:preprotein translocase subunit SecA [Gammaproteobacteria bacterium]MBT6734631.1 preprotein translocase subunit SecA [Gammaproteobacteria bacterium]
MISNFIKNIFGSRNGRILKEYAPLVKKINGLEDKYQKFSQSDFQLETKLLREKFKENNDLDCILAEAFALTREASIRTLGLRHFDEQLLGGIALHFGKIAEMKTGEGKTLVSTLPAYLNSLSGQSVFIITVNDYLALRDSEWMGEIFNYLGLSVGTITSSLAPDERKKAYECDVIYGTNNEFGFDYLRDNMTYELNQKVQSKLSYAIIDEVDSVLIDEARTPLVISGSAKESSNLYLKINKVTQLLIANNKDDKLFTIDEKQKSVSLTEDGHIQIEEIFVKNNLLQKNETLYDPKNIQLLHLIDASLKANLMYHKDIDYVVENNEIVIIDEFSGRKMPGRRWSEGLHQSVEAKESVKIQNENLTYASITFQNYFRLFDKLSGMTGTADTESIEFQQIYNLEVIVIPSHKKMIRKDHIDQVFLTTKEKYNAIIKDISIIHNTGQPILVGTTSIEASEYISKLLKVQKIKHHVLNAKQHQKEAEIISQAGKLSAVTIATNMAGRGTDIVLGGKDISNTGATPLLDNPEKIKKIGGLYIIGTERHESRRVDNQLRGRSGRQGDPGESRFYLSLEDNLMRIFASDKVTEIMKKLGMQDGEAIEHKWVSNSIENAQKRVEAYNFDIRKTLLEYDDIANEQRKVIYNQRNDILSSDDLSLIYNNILRFTCDDLVRNYIPLDIPSSQWDYNLINDTFKSDFSIDIDSSGVIEAGDHNGRETFKKYIQDVINHKIETNLKILSNEDKKELIRNIFLSVIDEDWRNHLNAMDYLRQGIGLRSYAQKNPKNEYKRESFEMFEEMLSVNNFETIKILAKIKISNPNVSDKLTKDENADFDKNKVNSDISRNALCPCGSGKKYKRCCGKL